MTLVVRPQERERRQRVLRRLERYGPTFNPGRAGWPLPSLQHVAPRPRDGGASQPVRLERVGSWVRARWRPP